MKLDSKYFSFCDKIGIMKENYTHQHALDTIIKKLSAERGADPKFKEIVSKLTLSSPQVEIRACVLYHYDMDVDYVVNGNIKNGTISEFGASGVPDSLHLTEYSGDGNYTTLPDVNNVPYPVWNSNNLFTLEEMKKALGKVIEKKLPSGATSYQSKKWSVSAFFVPTMVVRINYNKKEYQLYYNLQNGYHHWEWPDDPALVKKGNKTKTYTSLMDFVALVLSVFAAVAGIANKGFVPALPAIAIVAVIFFLNKKLKRTKREYQRIFLKNPSQKMTRYLISSGIRIALALFSMIAFGGLFGA